MSACKMSVKWDGKVTQTKGFWEERRPLFITLPSGVWNVLSSDQTCDHVLSQKEAGGLALPPADHVSSLMTTSDKAIQ